MQGFRWRFVYAIALGVLYFPASCVGAGDGARLTFANVVASVGKPTSTTGQLADDMDVGDDDPED